MREPEVATARDGDDQLTQFLTDCDKDRLLHTSRHPRNSGNIVVIRGSLMVMIGDWSCVSESIRITFHRELAKAVMTDDW